MDGMDAISGLEVRSSRQFLVSLLFARALEHFQAALFLLEMGMETSAKVAVRALCEATFTACAVVKDEETFTAYINQDLRYEQKLINKAFQGNPVVLAGIRSTTTREKRETLSKKIQDEDVKDLRVEELAKRAGMHDWYLTVYAMTSEAVHTQVRDLGKYFVKGADKALKSLRYGYGDRETGRLLGVVGLLMINARGALGDAYEEDINPFIDVHEPIFRKIVVDWAAEHPGFDNWGVQA